MTHPTPIDADSANPAQGRLVGVSVALLLAALGVLLAWQTSAGLAHVDRMMAERSETLERMVSTEMRNVARYGKSRVARLDEVLADVAASPDVKGVSLERTDGAIRIAHGDLPEQLPDEVLDGEGYVLQGSSLLRGGPIHIETQGCRSCRGCASACSTMSDGDIAGDYLVTLVLDGRPYLQLRRMVWAQGGAGGVLLLALAFALWLFQRQLQRSSGMKQALAVADERTRSLERLGRMAGGLAHEIKNPVGSLRGFAQLIAESVEEGSTNREYAELMVSELDVITRRVDRLRDFARPTPPKLESCRPNGVIQRVAALLAPDLDSRGLKLVLELPDDPTAMLDADRFRDLVVNLVINAIESSPEGGEITVSLDMRSGGDTFVLEVADQGPGISIEERERAIRPFHSTKEGGMGLGLAVAQQAIEDHGGTLEIDESATGGALIRASWPRSTLVGSR